MNRKSLFGRLTDSTRAVRTAERQEYFRVHLEPLEDRKMLAAIVYYNDNWNVTFPASHVGLDPVDGDEVSSPDFGGVSGLLYGDEAFGKGAASGGGDYPNIADAITGVDSGGQVLIGEGTHIQSDIVINKPLTMQGQGQANTFIFPETTSTHTDSDFPAGSHSGIIINSPNVFVRNMTLDGNGGSVGGSLNFHHGITTLYSTPGGSTVRNGTLTTMQLGPVNNDIGANATVPNLGIDQVTIKNTYWHGITISALQDKAFDTGPGEVSSLHVWNSTVDNVGTSTKTINNIGILVQNVDDNQDGTLGVVGASVLAPVNPPSNGVVVKNVGVGVKTGYFGTLNFGNQNGANNGAEVVGASVDNASFYAYWIQAAREQDSAALYATQSGGFQDGAVGIYLDHSRADGLTGSIITGYDTGLLVKDNNYGAVGNSGVSWGFNPEITPFATIITLTGPGTGVAGSVGVRVEGTSTYVSNFALGAVGTVTGFATGVSIEQTTTNTNPNILQVDRPLVTGNGVDFNIGTNSWLLGPVNQSSKIITSGTNALINPRTTNRFNLDNDYADFYSGSTSVVASPAAVALPDKATTVNASDVTLGSGSKFSALLTPDSSAQYNRWDFNNAVTYTGLLAPPLNVNGSLVSPQTPYGALTVWAGQVTQNGSGTLVLGGTATNGAGLGYLYGGDAHQDPNNAAVWLFDPENMTPYTRMNIVIKLGAGNVANNILFGLNDRRANTEAWSIPTSLLNSTTYTTISIDLMAPSLELTENDGGANPDDVGIDYSNSIGYVFGGDQGVVNGNQNVPLRFEVNDIFFTAQNSSMLKVSGAIDLGGATLDGELRSGFVPTVNSQFTIVNKTSVGAVTGTFAGLAQGATVTIGGQSFTINYAGGDGNDVVLTRVSNAPSFNATVTGRRIFYNNSGYDGNTPGAVSIAQELSAEDTTKTAYLAGGGGTVTKANTTSYNKGINGVIVEVTGTHGTLTASDFTVRMSGQALSANNTASSWTAAPAPSVTVFSNSPVAGTDRVVLIWPDNSITNRYLEVVVEGNDAQGGNNTNTGLAASNIFFYANQIGDTFNDVGFFNTDATDEIAARNNPGIAFSPSNIHDFNKDFFVDATDQIIARNNQGFMQQFGFANPPAVPAAPGGDEGDSAIAAAITAPTSSGGDEADSSWVSESLDSAAVSAAPATAVFAQLAESDSPGELSSSDGGDDLDSLLDSLLDDLA